MVWLLPAWVHLDDHVLVWQTELVSVDRLEKLWRHGL